MGFQGGWCEEKEENVWEIEKHRVTFSRKKGTRGDHFSLVNAFDVLEAFWLPAANNIITIFISSTFLLITTCLAVRSVDFFKR